MWGDAFLRLHPQASLKRLEEPYLYHCGTDELYELDDSALAFLASCDGSRRGGELTTDASFVSYCLEEGLLTALPGPDEAPQKIKVVSGPAPSLRYLELQLTHRCNLRCAHCYLGPAATTELSLEAALAITREFAALGGLRLLISGGEPLLYPALREFLAETAGLQLRRILLTNGTLLCDEMMSWLQIEEVQVSLDGWRDGHDLLRGAGNFAQALRGIAVVRRADLPLSVATMAHRGNVDDFPRLERFARRINAREWGVDLLCLAGNLRNHPHLLLPPDEGRPLLQRAYGGGYHGPSDGYACGRHLLTILPDGKAVKCGFYSDSPLGDARQGLLTCWQRLHHIPLHELACRDCPVLSTCGGGCRFRAGTAAAPDPVMCALHGVSPPPGLWQVAGSGRGGAE